MPHHSIDLLHHRTARPSDTGPNRRPEGRSRWASDRGLRSAFELRYQVYCLERSFLSPDDYPDGVESDEHDAGAAHFYAYDKDEELVGYVRLVRPDIEQRFPFQKYCVTSSDGPALPQPGDAVEISRLMLRQDYRRLRGKRHDGLLAGQKTTAFAFENRHAASQVLMTLYHQMYTYSRANNIDHWYAAMERPLARSLVRLNVRFKPIGPQTDYYGPVVPYLANLKDLKVQTHAE